MADRKYIYGFVAGLLLVIPSLLAGQSTPFTFYEVQPGAGCTILVRWETVGVADTLNYEIERSNDNQHWKVIARERVRPTHKYQVFDMQPNDSLNYYRVKQVSNKGSHVYSQAKGIRLVKFLETFIWPNPSTEILYVMTPFMSGSMDIFDSNGLLVRKIIIVDFTTSISTIGLASGVYFLHIRHADLYTVQRFMKE